MDTPPRRAACIKLAVPWFMSCTFTFLPFGNGEHLTQSCGALQTCKLWTIDAPPTVCPSWVIMLHPDVRGFRVYTESEPRAEVDKLYGYQLEGMEASWEHEQATGIAVCSVCMQLVKNSPH